MTSSPSLSPEQLPDALEHLHYYIGLDLGQKHDYSAIAVVEKRTVQIGPRDAATYERRREIRHALRYLERLPLHTPYTEIAARVRRVANHHPIARRATLIVDATGVGQPVVDMLRRADIRCQIIPVLITGGDAVNFVNSTYRVPKRDLVAALEVLFDNRRFRIPRHLPHANLLMSELQSFRARISPTGHDSYSAWREKDHDDLVLATALACWRATANAARSIFGTKRLL